VDGWIEVQSGTADEKVESSDQLIDINMHQANLVDWTGLGLAGAGRLGGAASFCLQHV